MSNANPYSSPQSTVSNQEQEFYQPKVFSFSGRIGRLRYLAYGLVLNTLVLGVGFILGVGLTLSGNSTLAIIGTVLLFAAYVGSVVAAFTLAVRRLNDMDKSGWLSLLLMLPLINLFMALYLLFGSGTAGSNNYGPQPTENSTAVIVGALAMPIVAVIGILAAVAIPAYQEYQIRANGGVETIPASSFQQE